MDTRPCVNPPIGEVLTLGTFQNRVGAHRIVNAIGNTAIVSELQLSGLTAQVLTATVLRDAVRAALDYGEIAFSRVGVPIATRVLALVGSAIRQRQAFVLLDETDVAPLAPAVANAFLAATGQRARSLPLRINQALRTKSKPATQEVTGICCLG